MTEMPETNSAEGAEGANSAEGAEGANSAKGAEGANSAEGAEGTEGHNDSNGAHENGAEGHNDSNGAHKNGAEGAEGPNDSNGAHENGAEGANGADDMARLENKRRQMREAQRRYYDKHKRKKSKDNPCPSYCPERIQAIKREYYIQHRDEIIARSKRRYQEQRALRSEAPCAAR